MEKAGRRHAAWFLIPLPAADAAMIEHNARAGAASLPRELRQV